MSNDQDLSRRNVLTGLAALGAGTMLPVGDLMAQTPAPTVKRHRRLIDVHHHYYPPELSTVWQEYITRTHSDPQPPPVKQWSVARSLEEMDKNGVSTSLLSIASLPGVWFGGDAALGTRLSRMCNEYAAGMVRDHPGRFGILAMLPMIDVDASLKEIAYAFDVLKADGIGIPTGYGDKWPGDPFFKPIFAELDRRKAVVCFHPRAPNCCAGLMPGRVGDGLIEYPYDTGRTILSLLFSGTLVEMPNIRFVFPQAGGAIPMLEGRIVTLSKFNKNLAQVAPNGIEAEFKKLYYETANSAYAPTMAALMKFVPSTQVLFGTDYPYVTVTQNAGDLEKLGLTRSQLRDIESGTASRLFPRLKV